MATSIESKTANRLRGFDPNSISGKVGITDANGEFTYYDTFSDAMLAATSGQTIHLFANTTETVTTTIKDGVDIQGNNYTVEMSLDDGTNILNSLGGNHSANISNVRFLRNGRALSSSGRCLTHLGGVINFQFNNVICENTYGQAVSIGLGPGKCTGLICIGYTTACSTNTEVSNFKCYSQIGKGLEIRSGKNAYNCEGHSVSNTGLDILVNTSEVYNSIGSSVSGFGTVGNYAAKYYDCHVSSVGNYAASAVNFMGGTIRNSSGINVNASILKNVDIYSAMGIAAKWNTQLLNCNVVADGNVAVEVRGAGYNVANCFVESKWNDAGGHAIFDAALTGAVISNCTLKVANAAANCINVNTAGWINNSFIGATTPTSGAQEITNLSDNQGNTST